MADVVLTHKTLKVPPAVVPEESVDSMEFYGWKRANKTLQANADAIGTEATPDPTAATA